MVPLSNIRLHVAILRPLWLPRIHCIAPQGTSRPAVTRLGGHGPKAMVAVNARRQNGR